MATYRTGSGRSIMATMMREYEDAEEAVGGEVYRELNEIASDSVPLVPVDTGALRASKYTTEPAISADNHMTGEVGYGGVATQINPKTGEPTSAYALAVHENLDAHHEVGQAKYLQIPFEAHIEGMEGRIIEGVRRSLHGGGPAPAATSEGGE